MVKLSSRRTFLTGAIGGGLVATAATSSLNKQSAEPTPLLDDYVDSYWLKNSGFYLTSAHAPLTEKHTQVDVAIIGGGFTGLATAYQIAKRFPTRRVVIVEAGRCGYGASGRNGGHAMGTNLNAVRTPELMETCHLFMQQGLKFIKELQQTRGIPVNFYPRDYVSFATTERDVESLQQLQQGLHNLKLSTHSLSQQEISRRFSAKAPLAGLGWSDGSGTIHPAQLALALKQLALDAGVEIFENTRVRQLISGHPVRLLTDYGQISADATVLATNAYTQQLNYFHDQYVPVISSVIATAPLTAEQQAAIGWQNHELLLTTGVDALYLQLTPDRRIIMGGHEYPILKGDNLYGGNHLPTLTSLETRLGRMWPQLKGIKITNRWGGMVDFTRDGLPSFGQLEDQKNLFYALGYSGEGVTFSMAAGQLLAQLYAGESSELTRSPLVNRSLGHFPPEPLRSLGVSALKWLRSNRQS